MIVSAAWAEEKLAELQAKGYDIHHIHRTDRIGYKAGALKEGMKEARAAGVDLSKWRSCDTMTMAPTYSCKAIDSA